MRELKKLVNIVSDHVPKSLPLIDGNDLESMEGRLFQHIKNSDDTTDEAACADLYGEAKVTSSYRMLKSRLRKKLLNNMLFADLSEKHFRKSMILHTESFALVQQANKLWVLGEPFLAERVADQAVAIAKQADLNDILVKAYEIKQHADLLSADRGKFERNYKLLAHYIKLDAMEREALLIFNKLKFETNLNLSNFRKQAAAYKEANQSLEILWQTAASSRIYSYYHLTRIGYQELLGNYEKVIESVKEAEELNAKGAINHHWFNKYFNDYILGYAYLRQGKLKEGLAHAKQNLSNYKVATNNWFAFLENYTVTALHSKAYTLATELCQQALDHGALELKVPRLRETWILITRYVNLLISHIEGAAHLAYNADTETDFLSKDKEGLNLSLLILEFLETLPTFDSEFEEQTVERFNKYGTKYLKGDTGKRARLFLKLLTLSITTDLKDITQKAAPILNQLQNTPPPRDPIAEVEIVPYEHLWELTVERLKMRGAHN